MIVDPTRLANLDDNLTNEIEAAVDQSPGIDPWCSGPDWLAPVQTAFGDRAQPLIISSHGGFALLAGYPQQDNGAVIAGFEPLWGFACPLVGPDPAGLSGAVAAHLAGSDWARIVLPGFPADLELARVVAGPLSRLGSVGAMQGIVRRIARIDDHWEARRSPRFRRNLRRAGTKAADAGVSFVDASDEQQLFDRLHRIEENSWKGRDHDGITGENMSTFYRSMIPRLQARGRCRAVIATQRDADIGFILGGVRSGRYRGLQLSYHAEMAHLELGHLLQEFEFKRLRGEACAEVYDLGMDMPYKERWADDTDASITLVVERAGSD